MADPPKRPPIPRSVAPITPQRSVSPIRPRAPSSPSLGEPPPAKKDEADDAGWDPDTADTVTSIGDETPTRVGPKPTPPALPPVTPAPSPTPSPAVQTRAAPVPPAASSTSPNTQMQGLTGPMREEVWAIVRAAISEATQPLAAKNRELEERVMRAEQTAAQAAAASAAPRPPQGSIPVLVGGSEAPRKPRLSVPPGVYGVAVVDPGPQKPAIDTSNVPPFDMPDFGGGKSRIAPKVIAGLMICIVLAVIVLTILSHS